MEISNKLIELLLFLAKRNIIFKYDIKEKHLIGHAPKKTIKLSKGSDESSYDLTISYLDNGDFIVLSNAFNNKTLVRTFYEEYLNNLYTTDKDISYIKQYKKLLKVFLGTSFENSIKCIKTNYMFEVIIKNHLMSLQVELHNSLYNELFLIHNF